MTAPVPRWLLAGYAVLLACTEDKRASQTEPPAVPEASQETPRPVLKEQDTPTTGSTDAVPPSPLATTVSDDPGIWSPLLITRANLLHELEQSGFSLAEQLGHPEAPDLTALHTTSHVYGRIVRAIETDKTLAELRDPHAAVALSKAHHIFDPRVLNSSGGQFELVAVVNRMDRGLPVRPHARPAVRTGRLRSPLLPGPAAGGRSRLCVRGRQMSRTGCPEAMCPFSVGSRSAMSWRPSPGPSRPLRAPGLRHHGVSLGLPASTTGFWSPVENPVTPRSARAACEWWRIPVGASLEAANVPMVVSSGLYERHDCGPRARPTADCPDHLRSRRGRAGHSRRRRTRGRRTRATCLDRRSVASKGR